jgi:hypothetical protein
VPYLRRIVAGFTPWKPRFDSSSIHVRFVVERVAVRKDFLRVIPFYPVSIILHYSILIFIYKFFLSEGQMGEACEPCKRQSSFRSRGALYRNVDSLFLSLNSFNTALGVDWINLAKDGDQCQAFVNTVMNLRITHMVEYFLTVFANVGFSGTSYRGDGNAYLPTLITRR